MNKFVILALAFCALGFYEVSGGANFDPEVARHAAMEARQTREAARASDQPATIVSRNLVSAPQNDMIRQPVENTQIATDAGTAEMARGLNLVSFGSVANPQPAPRDSALSEGGISLAALAASAADQDAPLDRTALNPTPQTAQNRIPQNPTAQSAPPRTIVFPGRSVVASSSDVGRSRDVRTIKGSLVNMRSGPGTDYDVIDQLPQATRVEVLTDTGNGWVELRPVDGGLSGWIAAFLLADG